MLVRLPTLGGRSLVGAIRRQDAPDGLGDPDGAVEGEVAAVVAEMTR